MLGIRPLAVATVQMGDDLVGAVVDHAAILQDQCRDLVAPGSAPKLLALAGLGGDLMSHIRDAELGEPLTDPM